MTVKDDYAAAVVDVKDAEDALARAEAAWEHARYNLTTAKRTASKAKRAFLADARGDATKVRAVK